MLWDIEKARLTTQQRTWQHDTAWLSKQKRADACQQNERWRLAVDVLADAATKGNGTELTAQLNKVRALATQLINALDASCQRAECACT